MSDLRDGEGAEANQQKSKSTGRYAVGAALFFGAPWAVYALLLWRQPADPFIAWHGDVAWPAEHFLTRGQGGLLFPIFAHVMVGAIGGLFASVAAAGVFRVVGRIVGKRDLGGAVPAVFLILVPVWAFVFVKAVPETVTIIDRPTKRLEVRRFQVLLRYPTSKETIAGGDIRALDLTSRWRKRQGDRYLTLRAHTRDGRVVELAERTCRASDEAACLAEGDADVIRLADWLGYAGGRIVDTGALHHGVVLGD